MCGTGFSPLPLLRSRLARGTFTRGVVWDLFPLRQIVSTVLGRDDNCLSCRIGAVDNWLRESEPDRNGCWD